jgi:hypothetical protein
LALCANGDPERAARDDEPAARSTRFASVSVARRNTLKAPRTRPKLAPDTVKVLHYGLEVPRASLKAGRKILKAACKRLTALPEVSKA